MFIFKRGLCYEVFWVKCLHLTCLSFQNVPSKSAHSSKSAIFESVSKLNTMSLDCSGMKYGWQQLECSFYFVPKIRGPCGLGHPIICMYSTSLTNHITMINKQCADWKRSSDGWESPLGPCLTADPGLSPSGPHLFVIPYHVVLYQSALLFCLLVLGIWRRAE